MKQKVVILYIGVLSSSTATAIPFIRALGDEWNFRKIGQHCDRRELDYAAKPDPEELADYDATSDIAQEYAACKKRSLSGKVSTSLCSPCKRRYYEAKSGKQPAKKKSLSVYAREFNRGTP